MIEQIGPQFHFDAHMRSFFAEAEGTKTMRDAVEHWYATREETTGTIGQQFEYNRFTRAWHEANPDGSRSELLEAWKHYRNSPIDSRGRI